MLGVLVVSGTNGGYGRGRPKFNEAALADIYASYERGEPVKSIARRYSCSPDAIYYRLKTTMRYVPPRDRHAHELAHVRTGACIRCGVTMRPAGLCLDCYEVEAAS